MKPLILSVTTASLEEASRIARALVEERLAACVQILPQIRSVYVWQGKEEEAAEALLFIKTSQELWPTIQKRIHELHSYQCPEIVALEVFEAEPGYLEWWREVLSQDS
jgi:periplasmic divalent cation tolerance protein